MNKTTNVSEKQTKRKKAWDAKCDRREMSYLAKDMLSVGEVE